MSTLVARLPRVSPLLIAGIAALQVALAGLALFDWRVPAALMIAVGGTVLALRWPVLALWLALAGRLLSTGSTTFVTIGGLGIGIFEPFLALALLVLGTQVVLKGRRFLEPFPWRTPLVVFMGWQVVGLSWAYKASNGLQEVVAVGVILAAATVIFAFVRTWQDFHRVCMVWVGSTVLMAIISMTTDFSSVGATGQTWEIAAGGGRETGLGQQPNWFSMHLMYAVLMAFGLAAVERRPSLKLLFAVAGVFIFFSQIRSGSRGGIYAIVIGATLLSLAHPLVRQWMARFAVVGVGILGFYFVVGGDDSTSKAVFRIVDNLDTTWGSDFRERNWLACWNMFMDTYGFGKGAGSYVQLIGDYDWKVYDSHHRYPHGIFWGLLAHYGVPGLLLAGWLLATVYRMGRELVTLTRGTAAEVFAWLMPATIIGYVLWSFVEFNFDEKPFWEYLGVYTALYLLVKRDLAAGVALEPLPAMLRLPWAPKQAPTT